MLQHLEKSGVATGKKIIDDKIETSIAPAYFSISGSNVHASDKTDDNTVQYIYLLHCWWFFTISILFKNRVQVKFEMFQKWTLTACGKKETDWIIN